MNLRPSTRHTSRTPAETSPATKRSPLSGQRIAQWAMEERKQKSEPSRNLIESEEDVRISPPTRIHLEASRYEQNPQRAAPFRQLGMARRQSPIGIRHLAIGSLLYLLATVPAAPRQQESSPKPSPVQPLDAGPDSGQRTETRQTTAATEQAPIALPPELAALMQQAEDDLQRKDYQGAIEPLKKVTAASPQTAAAWYYLGYAEHGLRQDDQARQAYEKAVALQPDLAEAQVNLGSLLLAGRDFSGALPHLQAAVKLKPNDGRAHLDLGMALDGAGQQEAAAQELERASALDPNSGATLLTAGRVELGRKHYAEAAADLTKALALGAGKPEAERDLAIADEALGQMPEAAQHLAAYLKLEPSDAAARVHLARLYLNQNQTELALAQLRQLDSRPLPPDVEASLGDAYALAGDFSDSEAHYRRALQAPGGEAPLHRALGETLLKEKKNAQAEAEFRKALAIEPGNGDAVKGLASSIYLEGRYADAAPMIERLLQSPDASPGLYFILATCYDHVRDRPRALAAYKQYLARANGSNPDQEWQAQQRVKLLSREIAKGI